MKNSLQTALFSTLYILAIFSGLARAEPTKDLIAAAKKEGELTTISLARSWCNYDNIIDRFSEIYGIKVNELDQNAASGDQLLAIQNSKANGANIAPDVIEVGLPFGSTAKEEGLLMPYKVATWNTIPDNAKDAEGYWYGDYYGALSFDISKDKVKTIPIDWGDLLKPEYAQSIALDGDPRVGNQAIMAVLAAGLSTETDIEKAADAGLKFFSELNRRGNFISTAGEGSSSPQTRAPIVIRWDYLAQRNHNRRDQTLPTILVTPQSGIVTGVYVQGISAHASHPNAAKLWMEYLYSDEGQIEYLKGHCNPIRFNDLVRAKKVPDHLLDELPPVDSYINAVFPSLEDQRKVKDIITERWNAVIGQNDIE